VVKIFVPVLCVVLHTAQHITQGQALCWIRNKTRYFYTKTKIQ